VQAFDETAAKPLVGGLTVADVIPAQSRPEANGAAVSPEQPSGPVAAAPADAKRLHALVDLARAGDAEAFGQLYDHYAPVVGRFLSYRLGSPQLAEDLASETFFRALRSVTSFRWQGKDFGAWLITIARNLVADHYKSSRYRRESPTDEMSQHDSETVGIEDQVLSAMTHQVLLAAVRRLPAEQQECVVLRFLQGMSIAETATALGRSDGAVKQLQLRAVRRLAKTLPDGLR
jgi:RNA polymerase sigma-70 factor (ECF subfamily)